MAQGLLSVVPPGIEGWAGNAEPPAEGGNHAVFARVGEQVGGTLRAIGGRARMRLTHGVLPGGWLLVTPQPYHQGVIVQAILRQTVKLDWPVRNHVLSLVLPGEELS